MLLSLQKFLSCKPYPFWIGVILLLFGVPWTWLILPEVAAAVVGPTQEVTTPPSELAQHWGHLRKFLTAHATIAKVISGLGAGAMTFSGVWEIHKTKMARAAEEIASRKTARRCKRHISKSLLLWMREMVIEGDEATTSTFEHRLSVFVPNDEGTHLELFARSDPQTENSHRQWKIGKKGNATPEEFEGVAGRTYFLGMAVAVPKEGDPPLPDLENCPEADRKCRFEKFKAASYMSPDTPDTVAWSFRSILGAPLKDPLGHIWGVLVYDSRNKELPDEEKRAKLGYIGDTISRVLHASPFTALEAPHE